MTEPNRKQLAFEALKRDVLTLRLGPGTPLDESRLADAHGLSRTPMREVLQRLAAEGYVVQSANRGATVASMDLAVMRNFFQTAPMVYAAIARLAAEHATRAQLDALKSTQTLFRRAVKAKAAGDMAFHNHQFHALMGEMAGNPYLLPSLGRLLIDHTRMAQTFYQPSSKKPHARIDEACSQHDEMIEAIERAEPARAVELVLAHWDLSRDEMERYVRPDPLPERPAARARDRDRRERAFAGGRRR